MNDDNDAGMEALADTLARLNSPYDHVYHPTTGQLMALFPTVKNHAQGSPERRAQEDAWEAGSVAMHASQAAPVIPESKPVENKLSKIVRSD